MRGLTTKVTRLTQGQPPILPRAQSMAPRIAWLFLLLPQSFCRRIQRFVALAESKSHLPSPVSRVVIETRTRHHRDSNIVHQIFRKLQIILEAESANISHHVIGAARTKAAEANLL